MSGALLKSHPAHIRLYDILFEGGEDLRALPFAARRARLEAWHKAHAPRRTDLSTLIAFNSVDQLKTLWEGARETGIEGLMLKRRDSPYLAGRPKGHWYKWKRAPLTLDAVPMHPLTDSQEDVAAARDEDGFRNRWFLHPVLRGEYPPDMLERYAEVLPTIADGDLREISMPLDFLGVNYYRRHVVRAGGNGSGAVVVESPDVERTSMGASTIVAAEPEETTVLTAARPIADMRAVPSSVRTTSAVASSARVTRSE